MAACRMARAAGKPVVVVKLGASAEGRAAALAHTGALAGAMEAFDAVAGAAGVIRVRTLDDVVEAVEYFLHAPLPRGAQARRHHLLGRAARPAARCRRGPWARLSAARRDDRGSGSPPCSASAPSSAIRSIPASPGSPTGKAMCDASRPCWTIPASTCVLLQAELPRAPGIDRAEANMRAVEAHRGARQEADRALQHEVARPHRLQPRLARSTCRTFACLQEVDKTLRTVRALSDYAAAPRSPRRCAARRCRCEGRALLDKIHGARRQAGSRHGAERGRSPSSCSRPMASPARRRRWPTAPPRRPRSPSASAIRSWPRA